MQSAFYDTKTQGILQQNAVAYALCEVRSA